MDGATILGASVAAVGLIMAADFGRAVVRARASTRWPATAGDVLDAGEHPGADVGGEGVSVLAFPAIRYSYEVAGRRYTGAMRVPARLIAAEDRPGASTGGHVEVRFDPRRPERSTVVPGATAGHYFRFLTGLAVFAGGIAVLLLR